MAELSGRHASCNMYEYYTQYSDTFVFMIATVYLTADEIASTSMVNSNEQ